jgi:hypothetical protein
LSDVSESLEYMKSWPPGMRRYWLELPSCCRRAFVAADVERDGNPEAFTCDVHGPTDLATDIVARSMAARGLSQFSVFACSCGQKNRVDLAKAIALLLAPKCGKCGLTLSVPS